MKISVNRPWVRKWVDPGTQGCEYMNIFAMDTRIYIIVFSQLSMLYS